MDGLVKKIEDPKSLLKEKALLVENTCVSLILRKATRAVTRRFDEILAPSGLRSTQTAILLEVMIYGPIKLTDLATRLVTDKSTMSRNIRPLEDLGYIKKKIVKGRRKHIFITEKGEKILAEVFPLWHNAQNEVLNSIKSEKWKDLAGILCEISKYSETRDY
jgi:DNA-binding MarR family transcriptional regulator